MKKNIKTNSIHQKGQRDYNEDFFAINQDQNLYIVCDGVGGSEKGEVASELACTSFNHFLSQQESINQETLLDALIFTEEEFDKKAASNPSCKGMATTLTVLKINDRQALLGHIGDSRIYHIRNGEILFVTRDHSYVNQLVASGFITEEEAAVHPKRNQITRAIVGTEDPTEIETHTLENIQDGDYFLLCSDGILEAIDHHFITQNFKEGTSIDELRKRIQEKCEKNADDNFTAVLIQFGESTAVAAPDKTVLLQDSSQDKTQLLESNKTVTAPESPEKEPFLEMTAVEENNTHDENKPNKLKLILPLLLGALLLLGGIFFFNRNDKTAPTKEHSAENKTHLDNKKEETQKKEAKQPQERGVPKEKEINTDIGKEKREEKEDKQAGKETNTDKKKPDTREENKEEQKPEKQETDKETADDPQPKEEKKNPQENENDTLDARELLEEQEDNKSNAKDPITDELPEQLIIPTAEEKENPSGNSTIDDGKKTNTSTEKEQQNTGISID